MAKDKNLFTTALALQITRHHTYLKGKEYFRAGKVDIVSEKGGKVTAVVSGTDDYNVNLWFDGDDELHYKCSCPVNNDRDGACKHVVATELHLEEKLQEEGVVKDGEDVVLPELTLSQARQFIRQMIKDNSNLAEELRVFLQGSQESEVTSDNYFAKYQKELSRIDLNTLLESWYAYNEMGEFDDGYYGDDMESGDEDNQLQLWVDEVVGLMQRYLKNENYLEVLKIGGGAIRALAERESQLSEKMGDLADWFAGGINKLMELMSKTGELLTIAQLPGAREQWEMLLATKNLDDYLGPMVMAQGTVLGRSRDEKAWESHVKKYLRDYPLVSIPLLTHYKEKKEVEKLFYLGERVLKSKQREYDEYFDLNNYYDQKDLMVQVRRLLDGAYTGEQKLVNLEQLFLSSHEIMDYQNLRTMYKTHQEKEHLWQKMEKTWEREYETEELFKVYKLENEKARILKLLQKYPGAECFAKMVREVRETYPSECYEAYLKKMTILLKPVDTYGYDGVAYHLTQMKEIGLADQFEPYLDWIKTEYKRRRRMMEAIAKRGL